ncbi:hypothetical protein QSJ18_08010 [Gordonia sp. ABSL1-1]|uniref:hypothetical protein n=1 Tax=Gordonia sp. ABSL1-1 TaxID=3053923 RepID=UPI002572FC17|nr:hypothetical protein [Gordonia sp. ABSL1-1]MDL9936680.1 hypothetical protein [Gordonia sp. ABSL1-1]
MKILILPLLVVLLALVIAVVVFGVKLLRSSRQQARQAREFAPGQAADAPYGWGLGHTPEERLFRRIRDTTAALSAAPAADAYFIDARVRIELAAHEVCGRLPGLSALGPNRPADLLTPVQAWAGELDAVVGQLLTGTPVSAIDVGGLIARTPLRTPTPLVSPPLRTPPNTALDHGPATPAPAAPRTDLEAETE